MSQYTDFVSTNPKKKAKGVYSDTNAIKGLYRRSLKNYLRDLPVQGEGLYRGQIYEGIGRQEQQANDQGGRAITGSLGMNNPTGLTAGLRSQTAREAPYGQGDVMARELTRRAIMGVGRELEGSHQRQANLYSTYAGPALNQMSLDLQLAALEAQNALSLGAQAGGGFMSGFAPPGMGGGGFA